MRGARSWDANSSSSHPSKGAVQEMVKIRLRRVGRKNAPFYRILVADSQSPRDGKFIEIIGQYAPRQNEGSLQVNEERANYWLGVGAQPTDTVRSLLRRAGILKRRHEQRLGIQLKAAAVPVSEQTDEAAATSA
jgi:small subunit ribosomal protein S16